MDISDLIKFRPPGADDGKPPKVKLAALFNRPVLVTGWTIQQSRFTDGSAFFAEVEVNTLDTQETVRFNTGSKVICDQLNEVSKELESRGAQERSFTAVIRSMGDFVKMFPCKESR